MLCTSLFWRVNLKVNTENTKHFLYILLIKKKTQQNWVSTTEEKVFLNNICSSLPQQIVI